MADKVTNLRRWKNGEVFNARDYVYERDLIVTLLNGHEDRVRALEAFAENLETDTFDNYLSKVATTAQSVASEVDFTQGIKLNGKQMFFNTEEGSEGFNVVMNDQVTQQVGTELYFYAKATEEIKNGAPVQFAGAQGGHLLIKNVVLEEINANPEYFIGVSTQYFSGNGDYGYVTVSGLVTANTTDTPGDQDYNLDFEEGKILWLDPINGGYAVYEDKPPRGYAWIRVAALTRKHANQGSIFVRPSIIEGGGSTSGVTLYTGDEPTDQISGDIWFN